MKKQRTIYLIILSVLTVCIVIGSICYRIGTSSFVKNLVSGNILNTIITESVKPAKDVTMVGSELALEEFTSIEVEADVVNFTIVYGDEYRLTTNLPSSINCESKIVDGTLFLETSGSIMGFNHSEYEVTVEIPEGAVIDKLTMNVSAGNVELEDIKINVLDVEVDAGNVEIKGMDFDELTLCANAGNVEIRNCTAKKSKFTTDAGNIEIWSSNVGKVTASVSLGNLEMHKSEFGEGEFETDLGEISIEAEFESIEATCSLGEVSIDTISGKEGKKFDIKADLGSIKIDGQQYTKEFRQ